jgi:hypothetical protein
MRFLENFRAECACLRHRFVKPVHLEPEEYPEAARRCVPVAEIRVSMRIPRMKLQHYFPIFDYLFVFGSAVTTLAIE